MALLTLGTVTATQLYLPYGAWFHQEMRPLVHAAHAQQRQTRPHRRGWQARTRVTGALILDDSVHVKPRGVAMRGLGRQCPLPLRLYRTRATCDREGEPFAR